MTGYPVGMDDNDAEAAFREWLARFVGTLPDGTMVSTFLSPDHLRRAFMAGLEAGSKVGTKD